MQKALIIGATGLVGSSLLQQLLDHPDYEKVVVLHRRSTEVDHPKLEEHIVDFDNLSDSAEHFQGDVMFSALGTTRKAAGSKEAQYKIDYTYQYEAARLAAENGVKDYVLVSSSGADSDSGNFYLSMKGELDESVQKLDFKRVRLIKPSILKGGKRKDKRIGERIGIVVLDALSWVPGIRKFRPIHIDKVARAMHKSLTTKAAFQEFDKEEVFEIAES